MPVDLGKLQALRLEREQSYTSKDVMLYALGLGIGSDPMDQSQLLYVYERDLRVLASFGGVLGYPGFWPRERPDIGITWQKVLNGEQSLEMHGALPVEATVTAVTTIERILDKGPERGSALYLLRKVTDTATGKALCTVRNTLVLRGDGGFGGPGGTSDPVAAVPDREPDMSFDWPVLPQAALLYRLSGDYNPVHADPEVARQAGFDRPILHGAASWGMVAYVLTKLLCGGDSALFQNFRVRFTSPAFPGEMQRAMIWHTGPGTAAFRVIAPERGKTILDNGAFTYGTGDNSNG